MTKFVYIFFLLFCNCLNAENPHSIKIYEISIKHSLRSDIKNSVHMIDMETFRSKIFSGTNNWNIFNYACVKFDIENPVVFEGMASLPVANYSDCELSEIQVGTYLKLIISSIDTDYAVSIEYEHRKIEGYVPTNDGLLYPVERVIHIDKKGIIIKNKHVVIINTNAARGGEFLYLVVEICD